MPIKRILYSSLTFLIMFVAVMAMWSFPQNSSNAVVYIRCRAQSAFYFYQGH